MNAGDLRHRITFQSPVVSMLANGEPSAPTWANVATVWADVRPATPREILRGNELAQVVTHTIHIRYRAGITADMRIVFGSRIFQLAGTPQNDRERGINLRIYAEETT